MTLRWHWHWQSDFPHPLFFPPVKEQKSKEMLIIYFYIYIYININFLFYPFSLKGELRNFGLSVSVSADLLHDPKKSSKRSGFSDFICNFAMSIVGFYVSFLQHEDTLNFSTWQDPWPLLLLRISKVWETKVLRNKITKMNMRTFTFKGLFLTVLFMLLGSLAIHAVDDGLIID